MQENPLSIDVACSTSKGDEYSVTFDAHHRVEGENFPGNGRIEAYGIDNIFNSVAMYFGPGIVGMSEGIIKPLGQPTQDGKGMKWDYTVDANGMLSVNGNPVTQLPSPFPR